MKNEKTLYYYLSRYRTEIMGVAILWVVWFHSSVKIDFFEYPILNEAFAFIKKMGYGGVDIFLLVSGMGIYNSLQKHNLSDYIRNRVKRIAPTWWVYMIFWFFLAAVVFEKSIGKTEVLGFATFTGYWLDMKNQANWYVYAIMLFYLISPVICSIIDESKNKNLTCLGLMMLAFVVSLSFVGSKKLIAFSRLIVYIFGMYVSASLKDFKMNRKKWLITCACFFAGIFVMIMVYIHLKKYSWYGPWWYPFVIIAPSMSLLLAKLFDLTGKALKPVLKVLKLLGKNSFEILLVSDYFFEIFKKLKIVFVSERFTAVFVVIVSLIVGLLFHHLTDFVVKIFSRLFALAKSKLGEKLPFINENCESTFEEEKHEEAMAVMLPTEE